MTTVHANSSRDALGRLEQMVLMTGIDLPLGAIRSQIASGLHFVIQLARLSDGKRRVVSISEITGLEGDVISMQDIFIFRKTGKSESGEILGKFIPTGMRPRCADEMIASGIKFSSATFDASEG